MNMEKELKKVKKYIWGRRQDNSYDNKTRFIYKVKTYNELMSECDKRFKNDEDLINYAICRFYNFYSHNGVADIFLKYSNVVAEKNKKHRTKDFQIDGVPFDLKLSVFPKRLIGKAKTDKAICEWMYNNQSQQARKHHKNRLFVIVLDEKNPAESWRLKSEFDLIEEKVNDFLDSPYYINLPKMKCAIIRVTKE